MSGILENISSFSHVKIPQITKVRDFDFMEILQDVHGTSRYLTGPFNDAAASLLLPCHYRLIVMSLHIMMHDTIDIIEDKPPKAPLPTLRAKKKLNIDAAFIHIRASFRQHRHARHRPVTKYPYIRRHFASPQKQCLLFHYDEVSRYDASFKEYYRVIYF